MTIIIKDLQKNVLYTKDCTQIILNTDTLHANLADTTYEVVDLTQGKPYYITVEDLKLSDSLAEFLARQVNVATWTDAEGVSHEGITNNVIQFRLF